VQERRDHWRSSLEAAQRVDASHGHSPLVDPDQVDGEALRECLELAEGQAHPSGAGYVRYPAAHTEPVTWYDAYLPQLAALPGEAAYEVARHAARGRDRLTRIAAALALVPLLGWLAWAVLAPASNTARSSEARVNDQPIGAWPSAWIVLGENPERSLALRASGAAAWSADGGAYIRDGVRLPVRVCVPAQHIPSAGSVRLQGQGAAPDRVYTLSDEATLAPDLVLEACDSADTRRFGALRSVMPSPVLELGQPGEVAHGLSVVLRSVEVIGAGSDAALTPDVARVVLEVDVVTGSAALDWTALAPLLRLATGASHGAPELAPRSGGVTMRYLIAAPHEPLAGEWRLADPASGTVTRWRLTIAPPDHDIALGQALRVRAITALDNASLQVTLANEGPGPLRLEIGDIRMAQGDVRLETPAIPELPLSLAPGEQRQVRLPLPEYLVGSLVLSIGPHQFHVER
jgi:hypothetical protein